MTARILGDWGTTRLRLYRMEDGALTGRLNGPGALQGDAGGALAERLAVWQAEGPVADVTLCGMAGAPGALVAAGYAPCPADADSWLAARTVTNVAGVPVAVLPGLSCRTAEGVPEVLRGEEAQVFGALSLFPNLTTGDHLISLPGTHSKWVRVRDGAVVDFRTHPSGELFALLTGQSTLTGTYTPGSGTFDDGFARGLERSGEPLTAALFEARAARMLDGRSQDWSRGYLSGLLIGGEVAARVGHGDSIVLIGDPALAALYERALTAFGVATQCIDGDEAVLAGLALATGEDR